MIENTDKKQEPCELLTKKIRQHSAIVTCPYCKNLFDIHVGYIFHEGKQTDPHPKDAHLYFEQVMK